MATIDRAFAVRPSGGSRRGGVLMLACFIVMSWGLLNGCREKPQASLDDALGLYYQNKLDSAVTLFQSVAESRPNDATVKAWLAETYRRLGRKEEAVAMAEKALAIDACNSFALVVIADAVNPQYGIWERSDAERTWHSVNEALRCDSSDGGAWLGLWGEALNRNDVPAMRDAERKLIETGFLTNQVLSFARWMLRGLPKDALLITNGDMDTYPTYAVQKAEGFRPDVVIVNRSLLNTTPYVRYLRDHEKLLMPFDDAALEKLAPAKDAKGQIITVSDQIFRRWTEQADKGAFRRPIAIAATVDQSFYPDYKGHLVNAGGFLIWSQKAATARPDIAAMQKSLAGVRPEDFAGPWTSSQDRSPIRRLYTKEIVRNVTATALTVGESLLADKKWDQAKAMAEWAGKLDTATEAGPAFAERIAALKKAAQK
jgi:tetratricopeptide (TPR) repeat protein